MHREALAIVFALEKFNKYIFGHHVDIFTDHKPLLGIFGKRKGEPPVIATLLQRYILRASIYDFSIHYRKGKENGNADFLSRLPVKNEMSNDDRFGEKISRVNCINSSEVLKLNFEIIQAETAKHLTLRIVIAKIENG
jgi:hypothetical protein